MRVTWLYGGDDGESHFADLEIPTTDSVGGRWFTEFIPAYGVSFIGAPTPVASGYHPAPRRQFVIQIAGTAEVELKDGSSRVFGPGDVLLADDTEGRGHILRITGPTPAFSAWVSVPKSLDLRPWLAREQERKPASSGAHQRLDDASQRPRK
jgi:hypothetical protein